MTRENTPALETERLTLRRFSRGDMAALLAIYGDGEANAFLPWFPLKTTEEAEALFEEKYAAAYSRPAGYMYALCLKGDGVPIGYVHLSTEDGHDLGYALRREFWHKGLVTEGCRAVLKRAKEDGLPYVTATHDVQNPRSGAVMRALGMRYMYSYVEQWQPKDREVTFRMYQLNFDGRERVYAAYKDRYGTHFTERGL